MSAKKGKPPNPDGRAAAKFKCPLCLRVGPCKTVRTMSHRRGQYLRRRRICPCMRRHIFTTYELEGGYAHILLTVDKLMRRFITKYFGYDVVDMPLEEATARQLPDLIGEDITTIPEVQIEIGYGGPDPDDATEPPPAPPRKPD